MIAGDAQTRSRPEPGAAIPSAYRNGYERTRGSNPDLAAAYVEHAALGDPLADAAVESLSRFRPLQVHRFIQAGMERDAETLSNAPRALRDFFERLSEPPAWFDPTALRAGCRAYHANSDIFLAAHVAGVLVLGFSTLISKSFFATGRLTDFGVKRLRRNIRHLIEITLPGGLERQGEGWKLSVRVRLVHAQSRRLIAASGDWDAGSFGKPLSAATIAFASANFSATLLRMTAKVGANLNREERASFMRIWRYAAWLMGTPEALLFRDEEEALELCRVALACEPPPDDEAIIMAHCLINSAPLVAGITEPDKRKALARYVYRVSRALIGGENADRLRLPPQWTFGLLAHLRWQRRCRNAMARLPPGWGHGRTANKFIALMETAIDEEAPAEVGISYQLPDNVDAGKSTPW